MCPGGRQFTTKIILPCGKFHISASCMTHFVLYHKLYQRASFFASFANLGNPSTTGG